MPWDDRFIPSGDGLSTKAVDKVEDKFADYFPETRQARLPTVWRFFEQNEILLFFKQLQYARPNIGVAENTFARLLGKQPLSVYKYGAGKASDRS